MEATLSFAPGRSALGMGADPLSAFALPSPGLGQDTPRFAGDRLSPAVIHLGDNISSSSSQRSYSSGSNYFAHAHQHQHQHQRQHQHHSPQEDSPWLTARQRSTTPAASSIPDAAHAQQQTASLDRQPEVGQMSVSLTHQVSLGGQTSLGHASLADSPSFGHSPLGRPLSQTSQAAHHWNSSRSLYAASADSYSARETPSPTTHGGHFTHQDAASQYQSTMSSNPGGIGGDGLGRSPNPQQHHHQQHNQQQHHQQHHNHDLSATSLHGSLLSSNHGTPSQARQSHDNGSSNSNSNNSPDTGSLMGYRSQPSPSIPGIGIPGLSSKLGGIPTLPSQSAFHVFHPHSLHQQQQQHHQQQQQHHHQHHGLPSPTHAGFRLIPPPLPSQAGLSGLAPPMGSYPGSTQGSAANRGYPYHHQGPPPPHSPDLSGPVISNLTNPGGQLTIVSGLGLPYGSSGAGPGAGGLAGGRRELLYSHGHGHGHSALHAAHLNPNQIGHHHLPGILGGKGPHGGAGGPSSVHERPFKCDQCPQSFNRNHDLKRHKRIHLAVKPFPCNYCDKSFSRKDALKRHRLVKGCGEKQPSGSDNNASIMGGLPPPPSGSVLSDTTSDGGGGNDGHGLR